MNFIYSKGKTYKTNFYIKKEDDDISISHGFHAYIDHDWTMCYFKEKYCNRENVFVSPTGKAVVKFIIPAGSAYYTYGNEIVSDCITLTR